MRFSLRVFVCMCLELCVFFRDFLFALSNAKIRPFLSLKKGGGELHPCLGNGCVWHDDNLFRCSLVTIAQEMPDYLHMDEPVDVTIVRK